MGRGARGVKGITLVGDDVVVGVCVVDETKSILTVTENGMGKRTSFEDFREMKHRGGKGVTCHKISDKTGKLAAIVTVAEDDDIMLITNEGTIIRTSVSGINIYSRTAGGVILMRLDEGCTINNVARLERQEEIEAESAVADAEIVSETVKETVEDENTDAEATEENNDNNNE
jgi:DNA gyrase subunit A